MQEPQHCLALAPVLSMVVRQTSLQCTGRQCMTVYRCSIQTFGLGHKRGLKLGQKQRSKHNDPAPADVDNHAETYLCFREEEDEKPFDMTTSDRTVPAWQSWQAAVALLRSGSYRCMGSLRADLDC